MIDLQLRDLGAPLIGYRRNKAVHFAVQSEILRDFLAHRPVSVQGVAIGNVCDVAGLGDLIHCANNADYLRRVEGRVIDLFLRSTDLFSPTRRAGDALSYVAFWDPYSSACRNPFADLTPP